MHIVVSQEIESVCPNFVGAAVEAQVVNTPYNAALWDEIHALEARFRSKSQGTLRHRRHATRV